MTRLYKLNANGMWCDHKIAQVFYSSRTLSVCAILVIFFVQLSLVQPVFGGLNHNEYLVQLKVPQCRKDCLDKVGHGIM